MEEHRVEESDDGYDDDDVGARLFPKPPIFDQAKIVSEPRLFSTGVMLGDLGVHYFPGCHKACFSL